MKFRTIIPAAALILLAGCATTQAIGPTVSVQPGRYQTWPQFQQAQAQCKNYALTEVGGAAQVANQQAQSQVLLSAGMGALIGSTSRYYDNTARQAAYGLQNGTNQGLSRARQGQYTIQQRYNTAYSECMRAQSRGY
jgi:hypothetical protein